jgi:putative DNA primase/helicase
MRIAEFTKYLQQSSKSRDGWTARCPAHDDAKASLSISQGKDGCILLHCFAGCRAEAIVQALGLTMKDLFPDSSTQKSNGKRHIVAEYNYRDEHGELLFQAVRFDPKDFRQRAADGKWSLKGIRRVLYRLPELLAASPEESVFICEGEKDCDRLASLGFIATTCPMGAGKWQSQYNEFLRARRVILLPDNDEPGRQHVEQVARSLQGVAESIRVLELPGLPPKGDISDWLEGGGTAEGLLQLAEEGPEWEPTPDEPHIVTQEPEFRLTDVGNGQRLVEGYGHDFRHCHPWRKDLLWDGKRWAQDETAKLEEWAKQTVKQIYGEALAEPNDDRRSLLAKHAAKSEHVQRIRGMMALARSEPGVPILPRQLDSHPWLLNCLNGTIDLRTGALQPHRREDYITKLCPVEYHPEDECPLWTTFLDKIFSENDNLIGYLQRYYGYCLTGSVAEQILTILYGVGANGKSTLINTILAMLGEHFAIKAASDLLMMKRNETHPTDKADLFGKRLAICIETEESRRLAQSLVKDLTGGDRLRARRMREDFWEFDPTHKVMLCTNHKPEIRGTDHAIWRRVRLVPFEVIIPDKEQDKELGTKLRSELSGILSWCVRGCLDWQREGLGLPDEVKAATEEYKIAQDVLGAFLSECCVCRREYRVKAQHLYGAYLEWTKRSGEEPANQRKFGESMTERGYKRLTNNGTWYLGLSLSTDEIDVPT